MKRLAIIGASGHGKVVADIAYCCGWTEVVFFDDAWPSLEKCGKWSVAGNCGSLFENTQHYCAAIAAIGNNKIRLQQIHRIIASSLPIATLIHPTAYVAQDATLGDGSVVCAGAIVQTETSIGLAAVINTGATVDHDGKLYEGVHVCPGAHVAGGVTIGARSWIGIGASVKQYLTIGRDVVVGAGAAVIDDISDELTVVGVPARSIASKQI